MQRVSRSIRLIICACVWFSKKNYLVFACKKKTVSHHAIRLCYKNVSYVCVCVRDTLARRVVLYHMHVSGLMRRKVSAHWPEQAAAAAADGVYSLKRCGAMSGRRLFFACMSMNWRSREDTMKREYGWCVRT